MKLSNGKVAEIDTLVYFTCICSCFLLLSSLLGILCFPSSCRKQVFCVARNKNNLVERRTERVNFGMIALLVPKT